MKISLMMRKAFAMWLMFLGCDEESVEAITSNIKGPQLWAYTAMNVILLLLGSIAIIFTVFAIF